MMSNIAQSLDILTTSLYISILHKYFDNLDNIILQVCLAKV